MVEIAVMGSFSNIRDIFKKYQVDLPVGESVQCKDLVPQSVRKAIADALKESQALKLSEDLTKVWLFLWFVWLRLTAH